jgi:hypothetical protein
MNKFPKQAGKYGKIFKSLRKIGLVFLLLFLSFCITKIQGTSSSFSDTAKIEGISFSAGIWIPTLTMTVSPSNPDGENGWYASKPCIKLYSDIDDVTIHYGFSGDNPESGTVAEGVCVNAPEGENNFSAYAVNNEKDSWISNTLTKSFKVGKTTVKTHIYKFLDGEQATPATADSVSFPMKTTYSADNIGSGNNIPFTLKPGGWSAGDIDYEASTSDMTVGADYSAWEVTGDDELVGATCDGGQPYALDGYTTGATLEAAKSGTPSASVPDFQNMQADKYLIVWNKTCEVAPVTTMKVHILKYLDGEKVDAASVAGYQFPMTATWKTTNLNGGNEMSGTYVLGNSHGGAVDQYGADTSPMEAPADYTTSEITDGASQVLPIGADCAEGKYRLKGYTKSDESFSDADDPVKISHDAPEFTGIQSDQYVIVWNETCSTEQPGTGEIRGTKYEDKDGDGKLEHGEHRKLSGWTIYLDTNDNGVLDPNEDFTVTRRDGSYRFKDLSDGNYHVREVLRDGWIQTYPASGKYDITVADGRVVKRKDFGNFKLGVISGMKFEDRNGNGHKERREDGLKNWTINLIKSGQTVATATTDADGNYSFSNLLAGNYIVREVQQDGWKQITSDPHAIKVRSGDNVDDINFGNRKKTGFPFF